MTGGASCRAAGLLCTLGTLHNAGPTLLCAVQVPRLLGGHVLRSELSHLHAVTLRGELHSGHSRTGPDPGALR